MFKTFDGRINQQTIWHYCPLQGVKAAISIAQWFTRAQPKSTIGPFARSGHMARNKLHWDANYAVGLSKQRKVGQDWYEFLCFGSPTA